VQVEKILRGEEFEAPRVDSAETLPEGQGRVPPTPGGGEVEEEGEEVPVLFIDLDEVYSQRGPPRESGAADLLEEFIRRVLTFYGSLRYEVFVASNPDFGDYIRSEDFRPFEEEEFDLEVAAKKYALSRQADLVVWLDDGYEEALALIWWEGEE